MNSCRRLFRAVLSIALPLALCSPAANASGGFRWGPPRPPRRSVEAKLYRRGQIIFKRKGDPKSDRTKARAERHGAADDVWPDTPESATFEQRLRLMELQGQLTTAEQSKTQLVTLAGKLTPDELAALKYYLYTREDVSEDGEAAKRPDDFDAAKFQRGKVLLETGEPSVGRGSTEYRKKQAEELLALEKALPARVRRRCGLTHLAGQLDSDDMNALRYYLRRRFGIK